MTAREDISNSEKRVVKRVIETRSKEDVYRLDYEISYPEEWEKKEWEVAMGFDANILTSGYGYKDPGGEKVLDEKGEKFPFRFVVSFSDNPHNLEGEALMLLDQLKDPNIEYMFRHLAEEGNTGYTYKEMKEKIISGEGFEEIASLAEKWGLSRKIIEVDDKKVGVYERGEGEVRKYYVFAYGDYVFRFYIPIAAAETPSGFYFDNGQEIDLRKDYISKNEKYVKKAILSLKVLSE